MRGLASLQHRNGDRHGWQIGREALCRSCVRMGSPQTRSPDVSGQTEIELKFLVPRETRKALASEMARGSPSPERLALAARYLDTEDRRLAQAGFAWRLRREGSRWIQTLKAKGSSPLERFEHEIIRRDESYDAAQHE